jgi:hypothetical protein
MKKPICYLMTTLLVSTAIAACSRDNERAAANPNTVAANRADDDMRADPSAQGASAETRSAAASLTQSRCSREQRCENIGAGKKYSSFADCEAEIGNDWREDLNARECSRGVNQAQLDQCLAEVRNEECGNPFDSLGRIAACTQAQICED